MRTCARLSLAPGLVYIPNYLNAVAQGELLDAVRAVIVAAPLFQPVMPRSGTPFTVKMSNCGPLGWIADRDGYRYASTHPSTGVAWPPIPTIAIDAWRDLVSLSSMPEACLVNYYAPTARMGLHQDRDEKTFAPPVLSLSIGDTCVFRYGGTTRRERTQSIRLSSGDALILGGESRLAFHGVDRVLAGSSTLLAEGGRFNLTMRRVSVHRDGP